MLKPLFRPLYRLIFDHMPDYLAVNWVYYRAFGKLPRLQHPQTFNEKVNWRKLYQRNPRFTLFADKLAVKEEIATLLGKEHVIETLWSGTDPSQIPYDQLEPPYVIKTNHSSGSNIFIRSKADIKPDEIAAFMHKHLTHPHWLEFREWGYRDIKPQIMVERMLVMPNGAVPEDYKIFLYHGKVHFIQIDRNRFTNHTRNIFDRDWNQLPVDYVYPRADVTIERPGYMDEMIALAEKIGKEFDFVRVDFYYFEGKILFGEATFYPGAGLDTCTQYNWEYVFGEPWKIHH